MIPHEELRRKCAQLSEDNAKRASLLMAKMKEDPDVAIIKKVGTDILNTAKEQLKLYEFFIKEGLPMYEILKGQVITTISIWEATLKNCE